MDSLDFNKLVSVDINSLEFSAFNEEWRNYLEMPDSYYGILATVVHQVKPKVVVELGAYTGASTAVLLAFLDKGSLYSIDKVDDWRFILNRNNPRLTLLVGDSVDLASSIPDNIDVLFIDTEHTKEQLTKEWNTYKSKMSEGGYVILDDIHLNEGMTEFWNSLPYDKIDLSTYHNTGFGVFRYKESI